MLNVGQTQKIRELVLEYNYSELDEYLIQIYSGSELKANLVESRVSLPSVQIDDKAIRFEYEDGGVNLFWDDLFIGQRYPNFQAEVMRNVLRAYNECIVARSK